MTRNETLIDGPYFEDLHHGQRFEEGPGLTLTEGLAAAHRAIIGGRLPLALDGELSRRVLGAGGALAAPNLAWDVAIGQSTTATHTVVANLFYRGMVFRRAPRIGDTLRTVTEVVGLRQNSRRAGRAANGLAALRMSALDQDGRPVLDFWRCAMLPLRDSDTETGRADDLSAIGGRPDRPGVGAGRGGLEPGRLPRRDARRELPGAGRGRTFPRRRRRRRVECAGTCAAHAQRRQGAPRRDRGKAGRLVYGGHTIGIALHQAVRALPGMVTVVGWHGCDHLGPVREGDTLTSAIEVERTVPAPGGGTLTHLRSRVHAVSRDAPAGRGARLALRGPAGMT